MRRRHQQSPQRFPRGLYPGKGASWSILAQDPIGKSSGASTTQSELGLPWFVPEVTIGAKAQACQGGLPVSISTTVHPIDQMSAFSP